MKIFLDKPNKDLLLNYYDKYKVKENTIKSDNAIESIYVILTEYFKKRGNDKRMGIIFDNNIVAGVINLIGEFLEHCSYHIKLKQAIVGNTVTSMEFEW